MNSPEAKIYLVPRKGLKYSFLNLRSTMTLITAAPQKLGFLWFNETKGKRLTRNGGEVGLCRQLDVH